MKFSALCRRVLVVALVVTGCAIAAPVASAAIPSGYLGNSEPCAAPAGGVPLYSPEWKLQWGAYGLETVPTNYGSNTAQRLQADEVVLTVPTINDAFVRVVDDVKFWFARRDALCVADVGVDATVQALAGGRPTPDLKVIGSPDPAKLALTVEHLTHIPAGVRNAIDARGGYGVIFDGSNITNIPGYEAWKSFQLLGPYATGRTTDELDAMSIGPNVNAGFGASVIYETETRSHAVHEYGHVYDYSLGLRSLSFDFLVGPQVEAQTCAAKVAEPFNVTYFTGNSIEWFAESFSMYLIRNAITA